MFQYSKYNVIEVAMPISGMNQEISSEMLDDKFCHYLENIIPYPAGSGTVRYGTKTVLEFDNPELEIVNGFSFTKQDKEKQLLLYTDSFVQDFNATDIVRNGNLISFNTADLPNKKKYKKDTRIKIVYTYNAVVYTLISKIGSSEYQGNRVSINLSENYIYGDNVTISEIFYSIGRIYLHKSLDDGQPGLLIDNLSLDCIPRCEYFNGYLLIYNGIDKLMSWNGDSINYVFDYVKELKISNIIRIDNNSLSFTMNEGFIIDKYYISNKLRILINEFEHIFTINSINQLNNLLTVNFYETNLPNFGADDSVEIFYVDYPPPFNFIYAAKDRLWALGCGPAGIEFRDGDQKLIVYYTYIPNSISAWFNENTKLVPNYNMGNKFGTPDNFEAICQINGNLAFLGREKTQLWSGNIPGRDGDFQWVTNISAGTVHGNLVLEMPNEVYFISESGVNSATTLNSAKQFSANPENAIDNVIKPYIFEIMSNNYLYRKCRSFKYNTDKIAFFKIGNNKIISSLFSNRLYAWFNMSGDFKNSSFFSNFNNSLFMSNGNKVIKYANGSDGSSKSYGDNDGQSLISIHWVPRYLKIGKGGKLFDNKKYEMDLTYSSSFHSNSDNVIDFSVISETPNNLKVSDRYSSNLRGDTIGVSPLSSSQHEIENGMILNVNYINVNKRFKFKSSKFKISVSGYVKNGPVVFKNIKLIGIYERSY